MIYAWTDYPLFENECGKKAPIRKVIPLTYDQDKYVEVEFEGKIFSLKTGYLYSTPGRNGEVPLFPVKTLTVMEY